MEAQPRPVLRSPASMSCSAELQTRLQTVLATRDRVYALLEAVVAIGGTLDLETVLTQDHRGRDAAGPGPLRCAGVIGDGRTGGRTSRSAWTSADRRHRSLAGGPGAARGADHRPAPAAPGGHVDPPEVARIPVRASADEEFLGVPIRIRDEVYGNLYLTEKEGGASSTRRTRRWWWRWPRRPGWRSTTPAVRGGPPPQRWLRASAEITRELLSGRPAGRCWPWSPGRRWKCRVRTWSRWPCRPGTVSSWSSSMRRGRRAGRPSGWCSRSAPRCPVEVLTSGEAVVLEDFGHDERVARAAREHLPLGPGHHPRPWAHPATSVACSRWAGTPGRCRWPPRR